jgi:CRISPR-associated protein Csy2
MNQYILINRIQVQNANAVAGFTWGFPAITHFLGFVHNLSRKIAKTDRYQDVILDGCAVIAHKHQVHTFGQFYNQRFIQSRNPPYLEQHKKAETPPVIEEGKMNMTVSLLIGLEGSIGNRSNGLIQWLKNACLSQRLAGGTILNINSVKLYYPESNNDVKTITHKLLPGFLLMDRSKYLENHFKILQQNKPDAELLDAWLDFLAIKQKARPKCDKIIKHLQRLAGTVPENQHYIHLAEIWQKHLETSYAEGNLPKELKQHFELLENNKNHQKLLLQWQNYCSPSEEIEANWEYQPKPEKGYLVPIMTGYKAISQVYKNNEVKNTRDHETDVCFVESVHSIGEWQSVYRIKTPTQLQACIWYYQYEKDWYLCKQGKESNTGPPSQNICPDTFSNDDIYN